MRLGGRLAAAIEILKNIETRRRPASEALKDWGISHRFAGAGDRAAIGNIVYDVLRKRNSNLWRMDSTEMRLAAFAALLQDGGLDIEELDKMLDGDKFAPKLLTAEERQAWLSRDINTAPAHIKADMPLWVMPEMTKIFGDDVLAQACALNTRPPLDLRVNSLKTNPDKLMRELHKSHAKNIAWFDGALRISPIEKLGRHPNVQAEPAFQKGWFEVQDLGSQIVAKLVEAKAALQILDYCAGAGGKTLALAAEMENKGQIHAYDAEKARLAPIFNRLRRAGVRNAQPHANIEALESLKGKMDIVLLDAPCTGSGTWRRRPDAKWRLTEGQLERRTQEQQQVLNDALAYLKPNGRLVYITCSLFDAENEGQIAKFIENNRQFSAMNMRDLWARHFNKSAPKPIYLNHGLALSPKSTLTDGFYISILQKGL